MSTKFIAKITLIAESSVSLLSIFVELLYYIREESGIKWKTSSCNCANFTYFLLLSNVKRKRAEPA